SLRDRAVRLREVFAELAPDAVVLVGGDTSRAVADALGVESLEPVAELLPGCPGSRVWGGLLDGRWMVNQAGAFGERRTLLEILHRLRARAD
ncbi:nucleotide-binding domain containing protein, partial [candidate division KSB1 bacterium]